MAPIIQPTFREIVDAQLAVLGWTRSDLARKSGYSRQMITNYMNDTDIQIGSEIMERILGAMGLEPDLRVQPLRHVESEATEKLSENS